MRLYLFFLVCFLLLSASDRKVYNGDSTPEKFKGNVKSVTARLYVRWENNDTLTRDNFSRTYFDTLGVARKTEHYDPSGKLTRTDTITYDKFGHRLEGRSHMHHVRKVYDSTGVKLCEITRSSSKYISNNTMYYRYDDRGNCILWVSYKENGDSNRIKGFTYDENNRRIEEIAYRPEMMKYRYSYNEFGQEVESRGFNLKDSLKFIDSTFYYPDCEKCSFRKRVDSKGNYLPKGSNITEYTYDKTGNWIRLELMDGNRQIGYLTVREIEYR